MNWFCSLFLICLCWSSYGQLTFQESTRELGLSEHFSGNSIAIGDINGDVYPDLILLDRTRNLIIYLNRGGDAGMSRYDFGRVSDEAWSMALADLDGDRREEIVVGEGGSDEAKIIYIDEDMTGMSIRDIDPSSFLAQGIALADMNRDHWVDVLICDDNATNRVYENLNGSRAFQRRQDWIDFNTQPPSDNSGNYGFLWTDLDLDGDLDGYLSKCRVGVSDPADPRRINQYFQQIDSLDYEESASLLGIQSSDQSWAAASGDLDNDGDMDLVVINHDAPSNFYENQDGIFVDRKESIFPLTSGLPIQVHLADFDNDMDLDVLITGSRPFLYENRGDFRFQLVRSFWGRSKLISSVIADLNNDGSLDIYGNQMRLFNEASEDPDRVWLNSGVNGNYLHLKLIGRQENTSSIGARVELYVDGTTLLREVKGGHSYGVQNSKGVHFGLAEHEVIDSLIVHWPDGTIQKLVNLDANQRYTVTQGGCLGTLATIEKSGGHYLCPGDSLRLWVHDADSVQWSTGTAEDTLVLKTEEIVSAIVYKDGCRVASDVLWIEYDPVENVELEYNQGRPINCEGEDVVLGVNQTLQSYQWNTADTTPSIQAVQSGFYFLSGEGRCRTVFSDTVHVDFLSVPSLVARGDTVMPSDTALLRASSLGDLFWYEDLESDRPISSADSLVIGPLFSDTCLYVEALTVHEFDTFSLGEKEHQGGSTYGPDVVNSGLIFDVHQSLMLNSVLVYTDFPGERVFELYDQDGLRLYSDTIALVAGENTLQLHWLIDEGLFYRITTNSAVNIENFNARSPLLWRTTSSFSDFPYEVDDYLTIVESSEGQAGYFYFYDWTVSEIPLLCRTSREMVCVRVDSISRVTDRTSLSSVVYYPNPFKEELFISCSDCEVPGRVETRIFDLYGRLLGVFDESPNTALDFSGYSAGIYILQTFKDGKFLGSQMVVKN